MVSAKSISWLYRKSARIIHLALNAIVVSPLIFNQKSVMYPNFFMVEGYSRLKLTEGIIFAIWAIITQILYISASFMSPGYLDDKLAKKFSRKKQIPETIDETSSIEDFVDDEGIVDDEEGDDREADYNNLDINSGHSTADIYIPKEQGRTFVDGKDPAMTFPGDSVNIVNETNLNRNNSILQSVNSLSTNYGKWSRLDDSNITLDNNPAVKTPGVKIQKKSDRLSLRQINIRKFKPFKNDPDEEDPDPYNRNNNQGTSTTPNENNLTSRTPKTSKDKKIFSFRKRHLARPKLNIPIRECKHCHLEQPLRCRHCPVCEKCIIRFDHHCPWVANCIGERNHGMFVAFLLLQSILNWWCFRYTLESFKHDEDWAVWMNFNSLFMLNFCLILLSGVPTTGLLFFHLYLVFTGTTTWENVSRARISYLKNLPFEMQPFDRGCMRNCFTVFFARYPVSWDRIYAMSVRKTQRQSVTSADSTTKILPSHEPSVSVINSPKPRSPSSTNPQLLPTAISTSQKLII